MRPEFMLGFATACAKRNKDYVIALIRDYLEAERNYMDSPYRSSISPKGVRIEEDYWLPVLNAIYDEIKELFGGDQYISDLQKAYRELTETNPPFSVYA